ncbi:hypothetical protein EZ428_20325 [Pedobacter frigiditerrae]|uniref:Uncharacterized protein n=1 Tax=Pedobacter frigiditerrae TaxID=2530452 RepID=A0A4R0MMW9_9SPHI|nr:hypothetical protein [Pedobacter frigiditerrae]TCC88070.1 hypothetical protein EZ428_20325 [Pedobacter frigiditerrae]
MENQLIPKQEIGSEMDAVSSISFETLEEAITFYILAKQRLAAVSNWAKVCGTDATTFELLNALGSAPAELGEGNLIKIDIPGPGTGVGSGYDWVKIEKIESGETLNEQYFGFRVRPCANPEKPTAGTAHFFKDTATSTFLIRLSQNTVYAEMHGRNEVPNTEDASFFDGLRNMTVGYTAKIGLSYPQWKLLVDGLVKQEELAGSTS